ncbi:DUF503 domain-containing protein [Salsuginibacillus kocurii]|uniref:DUF503 domain-containing protein n=1 Tax=Salsuginibacillus kocurii TaxID=427078 RepID=UPI000366641D|nr:DUF503 family protein [Salsuginibacillus kocurii]
MIGVVHVECYIYESGSLKEKRAVLQSMRHRLMNRLNVAVAEVDHQNVWQRTALTIVSVNSNRAPLEKELDRALEIIDSFVEAERTLTEFEWL